MYEAMSGQISCGLSFCLLLPLIVYLSLCCCRLAIINVVYHNICCYCFQLHCLQWSPYCLAHRHEEKKSQVLFKNGLLSDNITTFFDRLIDADRIKKMCSRVIAIQINKGFKTRHPSLLKVGKWKVQERSLCKFVTLWKSCMSFVRTLMQWSEWIKNYSNWQSNSSLWSPFFLLLCHVTGLWSELL